MKKFIPLLEKVLYFLTVAIMLKGVVEVLLTTCKHIDNGNISDSTAVPEKAISGTDK